MNVPYVRQYDENGKVIFPPGGVKNYHPSNRGERFNPRPFNNRKTTKGRKIRKQYIKTFERSQEVQMFRPTRNSKIKTWVKEIFSFKVVAHQA